jgi:hypothetical protein
MGHDPAKDFNDRLIAYMARHPAGGKKSLNLTDSSVHPREESSRSPIP